MRPANHEAFSGKIILLASTKPPWTNIPDNFEHVADHLTSPAMNFRPVIMKKKYCYLREFTAESSLIFTIKVIPQFCIAHPFCAYFNNKSLRNIFKMAAIFLKKNRSKRARNGRFSGLKRISKKKNGVKTWNK